MKWSAGEFLQRAAGYALPRLGASTLRGSIAFSAYAGISSSSPGTPSNNGGGFRFRSRFLALYCREGHTVSGAPASAGYLCRCSRHSVDMTGLIPTRVTREAPRHTKHTLFGQQTKRRRGLHLQLEVLLLAVFSAGGQKSTQRLAAVRCTSGLTKPGQIERRRDISDGSLIFR